MGATSEIPSKNHVRITLGSYVRFTSGNYVIKWEQMGTKNANGDKKCVIIT